MSDYYTETGVISDYTLNKFNLTYLLSILSYNYAFF